MRLIELIERAEAIAGGTRKLAAAIGESPGNVSSWRTGARSCPDRQILAMARVAGLPPVRTALEVYRERLGELARNMTLGAVAIIATLGAPDADAQPAAASGDYV